MGRRGCGVQRPVGRQAKVTLLSDKIKSSNGGDCGRMSPTREEEEHSGTTEDSGRSFSHTHIYPVPSYSCTCTSHFVLSLSYTLHIFLPDTYYSTLT